MSEVKYRHPSDSSLAWSGKGKQPKWIEAFLANGHSLIELETAAAESKKSADDYDLNIINDGPSLGETPYAQRIAAGQSDIPEEGDLSFTPGVKQALAAETETHNQNVYLAGLSDREATVPEFKHGEPGQQQLEVCLREFGFPALTAEEFIQAGADEFNKSIVHACRAGAAFWAAQEALKNKSDRADLSDSEFSAHVRTKGMDELIAEIGLPKERVYEAIRLAKFYARLPQDKRPQALSLGKRNALLLASLPQDVIDRAAESGNDLLDKADLMTVAELREEIRSLKRREKNYEAELERTHSQVKRLSEAKKRTTEFLLRTEEIREECMALQLGVELNTNSLQKLFDEVNEEDRRLPEWRLQVEQLWVTAHAMAARALDMLGHVKDTVRVDDMPERVQGTHILTPDEAARWLLDYPMIENRHEAEKATRQEKRDAAKPKGPGRPAGSGSKAKGA